MDSREVSVHDAAAVEALAKELQRVFGAEPPADEWQWEDEGEDTKNGYRAEARYVLQREAGLVAALKKLAAGGLYEISTRLHGIAVYALAAHRAASAPEEPTPDARMTLKDSLLKALHADHASVETVERIVKAVEDIARERQQVKP